MENVFAVLNRPSEFHSHAEAGDTATYHLEPFGPTNLQHLYNGVLQVAGTYKPCLSHVLSLVELRIHVMYNYSSYALSQLGLADTS